MGNSDFFQPTRTANFSEEVFQQPQPISPAIRTDATVGLFMRWLVVFGGRASDSGRAKAEEHSTIVGMLC